MATSNRFVWCSALLLAVQPALALTQAELGELIGQVKSVATAGATPQQQRAIAALTAAPTDQLDELLRGMSGASPLAENYLRSAADAVAERALVSRGAFPANELREVLADDSLTPHARRVAYEWLVTFQPKLADELLPALANDSSLELRYDAVAQLIAMASDEVDKPRKTELLQQALSAARNVEQLETCRDELAKLDVLVNLGDVLGFVRNWQVIGPFDYAGGKGFAEVYPPEENIDLAAKYPGKKEEVSWKPLAATDEMAELDLNAGLVNEKEVVGYAYTTINSPTEQPVEVRYGSKNATKVWLNGEVIADNEVYHSGSAVDQYSAPAKLRAGENTILVKIVQNDQTQPWTNVWGVQLRLSDSLGGATKLETIASE
jgi:hypothetical protein